MCYFGYLGVELTPAKLPPTMRTPAALWSAVSGLAARHHAGGLRPPAGGKTRGLSLGGTSVVGELACSQCACDDRERLLTELEPLARELLDAGEVRSVVLGYLWASGEPATEVAFSLDALPLDPTTLSKGSFIVRVTRAAGPPWPTQSLAQRGGSNAARGRRRGLSAGRVARSPRRLLRACLPIERSAHGLANAGPSTLPGPEGSNSRGDQRVAGPFFSIFVR